MVIVNLPGDSPATMDDAESLREIARLPRDTVLEVVDGALLDVVPKAKLADLNVFSLEPDSTLQSIAAIAQQTRISALFCADSGNESALV